MATNALSDTVSAPQQAETEVLQLMNDDASKGAVPHVFDPNALPEEKASQPAKAKDKLKPSFVSDGGAVAARGMIFAQASNNCNMSPTSGLPVVTGNQGDLPTITVEDADGPRKEEREKIIISAAPSMPGDYYTARSAAEIPTWLKVGWRDVTGVDALPPSEQEKEKAILQHFLYEQFYGDWYHNGGIIIFVSPVYGLPVPILIQDVTGRLCFTFLDALPLRLGLAIYPSFNLLYLLRQLYVPCQTSCPR